MHIASIGIDLGKTTFHLVALGERNKVLVRKKFSRAQLLAYNRELAFIAHRPRSLCGGQHCRGRVDSCLREEANRIRKAVQSSIGERRLDGSRHTALLGRPRRGDNALRRWNCGSTAIEKGMVAS